jgi:hypothetical protein
MKPRLFIAAIALAASSAQAGESVSLRVTPRFAMEPATVRITALVPRNGRNRALEIEADSQDFYRSSLITLDGANAASATVVEFRDLPGGLYAVTARVFDGSGRVLRMVEQDVEVMSGRE